MVLSEKEEILLYRYLDNELRWYDKIFINKLLKQPLAKDFINQHKQIQEYINNQKVEVDFWNDIKKRIVEEERTEQVLGKRREKESFGLAYALAGAVAAVVCISIFPIQKQDIANPSLAAVKSNLININHELEVEWMRSDKRVQMIDVPNKKQKVIWVKRRFK